MGPSNCPPFLLFFSIDHDTRYIQNFILAFSVVSLYPLVVSQPRLSCYLFTLHHPSLPIHHFSLISGYHKVVSHRISPHLLFISYAYKTYVKAVVKRKNPRTPAFQPFIKPVSYFLQKQLRAVQCLYQLEAAICPQTPCSQRA